MTPKATQHIIRGMRQDTSNSKASKEFAFYNHNIRITAREDHTLLSITNEKKPDYINDVQGQYIGHCVVGDYLVLFIHLPDNKDKKDKIEIAQKDKLGKFTTIYEGNLNFSTDNLIEALGVYENEDIQKVYWVDGRNQPRVINIKASKEIKENWNDNSFNFVPELALQESISVEPVSGSSMFAPGVIQYAFTYYNKNGQESNIFNVTPLCYIAHSDRGGSPDEVIKDLEFKLNLINLDPNFDYIRIYSIHRTSLDSVPTVKYLNYIPIDKSTESTIITKYSEVLFWESNNIVLEGDGIYNGKYLFQDWGITNNDGSIGLNIDLNAYRLKIKQGDKEIGEIKIDGNLIKYFKSEKSPRYILVFNGTVEVHQKIDNQLPRATFIDNGYTGSIIDPSLLLYIGGECIIPNSIAIKDSTLFLSNIKLDPAQRPNLTYTLSSVPKIYNKNDYKNSLINNLAYFKQGEVYRLGVQFQNNIGKWEDPIFIEDYEIPINKYKIETDNYIQLPQIECTISDIDYTKYKRVRGVVSFPNSYNCIAQGILCPTVYNTNDREQNNPYVQPSWFFRCNSAKDYQNDDLEFRHNASLITGNNLYAEIQNGVEYKVDQSIFTLNSPDLNNIVNNNNDIGMRILGVIEFANIFSDIDIQTDTPKYYDKATGFLKYNIVKDKRLISDYLYEDSPNKQDIYKYLIYPWHKSNSLNDAPTENIISAKLKNKKLCNLLYSTNIKWLNKCWELDSSKMHCSYIDSYTELTKLNLGFKDKKNYFSNIDTLLTVQEPYAIYKKGSSNNIDSSTMSNESVRMKYKTSPHYLVGIVQDNKEFYILPSANNFNNKDGNKITINTEEFVITDTSVYGYNISAIYEYSYDGNDYKNEYIMTMEGKLERPYYKLWYYDNSSNRSLVTSPNLDKEFPTIAAYKDEINSLLILFGMLNPTSDQGIWYKSLSRPLVTGTIESTINIKQDDLNIIPEYPFLYLAELYNKNNKSYEDPTESTIKNTIWFPASTAQSIDIDNKKATITYEYGDTRYQRYDCLKTYAYTPEDENQVVEIASFMCETRVNMLGRYDKNIGNLSNLNADPTNFNLFNPVYSQKDNFFNYRILDSDMYKLNNFPNTITWSKEKHAGEDVDTWTNITMANTLDLDGNKGEIKKLVVHNNRILAFQEKGIAEVLFNSRVQIPTSDGVPIEITNGYKVEGFRYISDGIGSKNKNSITVTPSGVYFLDSNSNSIYLLTDGLTNLSTEKGFEIWTKNVANESSFKTFYDNVNKDVYFTTSKECLGYSEKLGEFTSFYDYYNSDSMFNIGNSFYRLHYNSKLCLDEMFAGDYTNNYSIEFITNENPYTDKVFSHIEYRADFFDSNNNYLENESFDTLEVWNEYQGGKETLKYSKFRPSNLKKKFRMWRANIPRDKKNKLDRMRNPWLYIKLSKENPGTSKMELHDIIVHYFE